MEALNVGLRRYASTLVFWTAFAISAAALAAAVIGVSRIAAAALLIFSLLFKLWIQWQNDRGGFMMSQTHRSRFSPAETLSPVRWLVLIFLILIESVVLLFVFLAPHGATIV